MSYTVIDLSQLPPPKVVEELSIEAIFAEQLEELRGFDPELADNLKKGDPAYNQLLVSTAREYKLRQRVNEGAKAIMLPYAVDADLENLGAFWNVEKLVIDPGDPDAIPPREPIYEEDDDFRYRIQLAMEGQTNAGTEAAYIFHTLSADGLVKAARPKRLGDASVLDTVLSREGDGTPSEELLTTVRNHLQQPHVRQLTDEVIVQGASIKGYRVKAVLYIARGVGADQVMTAAREALIEYVESVHRIGFMVSLSGIYGALKQPGVVHVDLLEPTGDITTTDEEAAFCTAIELTQEAG